MVGNRILSFDGVTSTFNGFQISNVVHAGIIDPNGTGDPTEIAWSELAPHPGDPTYRAAASQGAAFGDQVLVLGGTSNPYNIDGIGYNNQPAFPLEQALLYDTQLQEWSEIDVLGNPLATMDHRGLVEVPGGWATVGGMVAPGEITDQVVHYEFNGSCVPEPLGKGVWISACCLLAMWYRRIQGASNRVRSS